MWRRLGFIGAGQMATALAHGFVSSGAVQAGQLLVADPSTEARRRFQEATPPARWAESNEEVVANSDIVFLVVKPQMLEQAVNHLSAAADHQPLFVSIVAGATVGRLSALLHSTRIVRVMPNTPCLIGRGASAYCCGAGVSEVEAEAVGALLRRVGLALQVVESQMDAVTGLSGSGPAYVFEMIEALADGGVLRGLGRCKLWN